MLASMATYPPVTLVVGEEEFLVDRAVRQAIAQARAALAEEAGGGDGGGDLHDLEASALGVGEINALTSPSLFGGGSTVIVRNAQNAGKEIAAELTKYAKAPAPDAAVILTHAGGVKGKALVTDLGKAGVHHDRAARSSPARASAPTSCGRSSGGSGRQADEDAVRALLDAIGGDLRELASAVDQLASDTDGRINNAMVARYYRGRAEATGFSVADHAVEGRLNEALEQLRWALATGTAPVLITSALATGVRLLGRVGAAPGTRTPTRWRPRSARRRGRSTGSASSCAAGTRTASAARCRPSRRRTPRSRAAASAPSTPSSARSGRSSPTAPAPASPDEHANTPDATSMRPARRQNSKLRPPIARRASWRSRTCGSRPGSCG